MRSLTVRLPDQLVAEIEGEARQHNRPKSDIIRERLERGARPTAKGSAQLNIVADLIGSVDGLPPDLSRARKSYLKSTGYGKKRHR